MIFDKEGFAALLLKAKGERSVNGFGNSVDISPAHISRLSRAKIDTPPSPETISKLSKGARNGVTYNDLMLAAGHISLPSDPNDTSNEFIKLESEAQKQFIQIIISELYQKDYEWAVEKIAGDHYRPDMTIRIKDSEYSTWLIEIKSQIKFRFDNIYNLYGIIATLGLPADTKFTIAVDSIVNYDEIISTPPKSMRANVFVMLVDLKERKIVKEERLCSY